METIDRNQEKEGPARPPCKEDVIAMLKAFQDHIDSGGGIGQVNEEGDDFVEIQEEWDADGNVEEKKNDDEEGSLDEVEFDDDAFESMMQEMEELELAAAEEEDQSSAVAVEKTQKHSNIKRSAKSPTAASASPGMKRGFLLPNGKQKPSNKGAERESSTTDAPTTTAAGAAASRPMAFTGAVVERQPVPATSRLPSTASTTIDSPQGKLEPQKVSKFKQRMYGDGS